jgi:ABC-type nickel/cobalt efflux system permease component RcnA
MGSRLFWLSFGSALLITSLAAWVSWEFFIKPMDAAVRTANLLHEKFQDSMGVSPRILANAGVLFSQKSELESLVLSSGEVSVRESFAGQKPGGGDFSAGADFQAEAGFFFREALQINVRRGGAIADVSLPQIKILRLEMSSPVQFDPGDLAWKALSDRLQTRVSRSLERRAKRDLLEGGLLKRAEHELREKVRHIASQAGCEVVFVGSDKTSLEE